MDNKIDQNYRDKFTAIKQQLSGLSPEDRKALALAVDNEIASRKNPTFDMGGMGGDLSAGQQTGQAIRGLGNQFLQMGGVTPNTSRDLNTLMMREYVKNMYKNPAIEDEIPEGYAKYGNKIVKVAEKKEPTFSQVVSGAKKKLSQGMALEDLDEEEQNALEMAAPKLIEQFTPIEASPMFKKPNLPGLLGKIQSFKNPNVARISPKAQKMINQIKTMRDFNNFTKEVDNKISSGAFTDDEKNQVLEYFGKR